MKRPDMLGGFHFLVRRDEDKTETGGIHERAPVGLEERGIDELAIDAFVGSRDWGLVSMMRSG